MAKLAIKGHATRGKEVIEILEMLGGKQGYEICTGSDTGYYWYIKDNGLITCNYSAYKNDCVEYTLEEFLQEFPYKVGDKVSSKYLKNYKIEKMEWEDTNNKVIYKLQGMGWYSAEELQPYKEETMEETDIIDHTTEINLNHPCFGKCNEIELIIPDGWEFQQRGNKMFGVRKQYPKTYEECCKMLNIISNNELVFSNPNEESEYAYRNKSLYNAFDRLKICRDAYWKLYGEQMGLGKPWEPDCKNAVYGIFRSSGIIKTQDYFYGNTRVLEFPTEEMRDAFYENFKDLIEECKELL